MIEVTFAYQRREINRMHQLNQPTNPPGWLLCLVCAACVVPELIVAWYLDLAIATLGLAVMLIGLVSFAIKLYARPGRLPIEQNERTRRYTAGGRYEKISHSEFECRWRIFDTWRETDWAFEIVRPAYGMLEPKRVLSAEQCGQLRSFLAEIDRPAAAADSEPELELYQRLVTQVEPEWSTRFHYLPEDFRNALTNSHQPVEEEGAEPPAASPEKTQKGCRNSLFLFFCMIAAALVFLRMQRPGGNAPALGSLTELVMTGLLVLAPLVLIWLFLMAVRWNVRRNVPELPAEEYLLALLADGCLVGTPDSVTFYNWLDVDGFFQNESTWLLSFLGQRILIPKRIFAEGGPDHADQVLRRAMRLRSDARVRQDTQSGTAITGTETGNPFQPPGGG